MFYLFAHIAKPITSSSFQDYLSKYITLTATNFQAFSRYKTTHLSEPAITCTQCKTIHSLSTFFRYLEDSVIKEISTFTNVFDSISQTYIEFTEVLTDGDPALIAAFMIKTSQEPGIFHFPCPKCKGSQWNYAASTNELVTA